MFGIGTQELIILWMFGPAIAVLVIVYLRYRKK